jgi:hypothetical protein
MRVQDLYVSLFLSPFDTGQHNLQFGMEVSNRPARANGRLRRRKSYPEDGGSPMQPMPDARTVGKRTVVLCVCAWGTIMHVRGPRSSILDPDPARPPTQPRLAPTLSPIRRVYSSLVLGSLLHAFVYLSRAKRSLLIRSVQVWDLTSRRVQLHSEPISKASV